MPNADAPRADAAPAAPWHLYLIECADGRLYAGITNDLPARFAKHASGKGAAFMRMSRPLRYVATRSYPSRGEAASAEAALKRLARADKLAWASANPPTPACG